MWEGTNHTDFLRVLEAFDGTTNLFRLSGRRH
jgi:hypothetical protein